ncbi:F-box protein SKIP19-like [Salvia hispanica]|uniref:F-box protein SKIP19-like n=1 Tax=Salvia hispanica TaxID=49212 RepID=UPI002009824E|nr:F-box protein SKIP19-like [Salvia hispanica]
MLPPPPPWTELPEDLTANILQRLHTEEILESAQKVCTTWWRVCKNPAMWRVIDLDIRRPAARNLQNGCSCIPNDYDKDLCYCAVDKFENICRCAVDRSQGQLVELKLASFEVDCLLKYIADRITDMVYDLLF